ncbi:enoyl-CoA hydratase/isomerase family protein [Archangium primigenium]|uniref:enoyl-CoA hydratase/isomerase family protein n=1 Tax=[Archangium] primigenium TaxID=2792470 RepID=UPI00195A8462|nr:enoyl-CoA hydratase/isomerase family protein [Archangium primigenium]MBM7114312.1 enoyl-CoA hydratase/isomerase family protein [Archangium primigenium]
MTASGASLAVEWGEDGVLVLRWSNPARRNALDDALVARLDEALSEAPSRARAVLLSGEGSVFCSGYDLHGLAAPTAERLPDDALMACLERLETLPLPTVALVNGAAFGAGFDLAMACDFRVGLETALFCMPPARLGIVYAMAGLSRATRLVGLSRAKMLFLSGRRLDAREALAWGLLDECSAEADRRAMELCRTLAQQAPLAVAGMKEGFHLLARPALSEEASRRMRDTRARAFASEDAREGKAAFLEKRPPRFHGR